jgi:hypothetical protein
MVDLGVMSKCLLSKWLGKLKNSEGISQSVVRAKYLQRCTLTQCVRKNKQLHFWQGLMNVSSLFYLFVGKLWVMVSTLCFGRMCDWAKSN